MSYFIFLPNLDSVDGTLYRIAENQNDLINLNISQSLYKIIEDTQDNFDAVKYGNKSVKYNNNVLTFTDSSILAAFRNKGEIEPYITSFKKNIKQFTDNNPNHPLFSRWNEYYNQLNNLNLDSLAYPLNKSLEQYFNDLGQPSLNPLQLP
jgi:hypothetical protein